MSNYLSDHPNRCAARTAVLAAATVGRPRRRPVTATLTSMAVVTALVLALSLTGGCGNSNVRVGQPLIHQSQALARAGGRRILVVVSAHPTLGKSGKKTGYWLSEVTHFYHVLARHGFQIDFTSPGGKPSVMDPGSFSLDDSLNRTFWENAELRAKLERPLAPEALDPKSYAVIYYAGGHGTMWDFPESTAMAQLAARIFEQGDIVSAVCHGPAGLLNIKLSNGEHLVKGRRVTGFANFEERIVWKTSDVPYLLEDALKERGGSYSKAFLPFNAHVVTDGRLITGQNPGSATGVAEAVITALAGRAAQ